MSRQQYRPEQLTAMRAANNPNNEPTGHFTGRCSRCGSNDLWDDNLAYGCNTCDSILAAGDAVQPRLVRNNSSEDR